jgi:Nucleoside diphosphate kinase
LQLRLCIGVGCLQAAAFTRSAAVKDYLSILKLYVVHILTSACFCRLFGWCCVPTVKCSSSSVTETGATVILSQRLGAVREALSIMRLRSVRILLLQCIFSLIAANSDVCAGAGSSSVPFFGKPGTVSERSLFAIKPDGLERGLVGKVIERFERKGLKLVAMKLVQPTAEQVIHAQLITRVSFRHCNAALKLQRAVIRTGFHELSNTRLTSCLQTRRFVSTT